MRRRKILSVKPREITIAKTEVIVSRRGAITSKDETTETGETVKHVVIGSIVGTEPTAETMVEIVETIEKGGTNSRLITTQTLGYIT